MALTDRLGIEYILHTTAAHQHLYLPAGLGDEDLDVAVFRFTLGIPGFDDSNIPRVVGAVVAALVVVNHFLGAQPAPPAQVGTCSNKQQLPHAGMQHSAISPLFCYCHMLGT